MESEASFFDLMDAILDSFDGGDWKNAKYIWDTAAFTLEQRAESFEFLDSKERAYLKGEDRQYLIDAGLHE